MIMWNHDKNLTKRLKNTNDLLLKNKFWFSLFIMQEMAPLQIGKIKKIFAGNVIHTQNNKGQKKNVIKL